MKLPADFQKRMQRQLGGAWPAYLEAMTQPPRRALRVNTLKTSVEALLARGECALEPGGVTPECFLVPEDF
ncbi:MAG: rRNA methyltransferase, partial [Clostridia bacterium]|nr:rRNA methyltransferase [Clostridia bacterium]